MQVKQISHYFNVIVVVKPFLPPGQHTLHWTELSAVNFSNETTVCPLYCTKIFDNQGHPQIGPRKDSAVRLKTFVHMERAKQDGKKSINFRNFTLYVLVFLDH